VLGRPMAKTETLNLRVSADFKRRLREEAAKEKRSVTNYLEATLTRIWEPQKSGGSNKVEKRLRK
jgi:predicted HicB family RNase H-like nuclease